MTTHSVTVGASATLDGESDVASPVGAGAVSVTSDGPAAAVACRTEVADGAGMTMTRATAGTVEEADCALVPITLVGAGAVVVREEAAAAAVAIRTEVATGVAVDAVRVAAGATEATDPAPAVAVAVGAGAVIVSVEAAALPIAA